jgi:hypothetical protein
VAQSQREIAGIRLHIKPGRGSMLIRRSRAFPPYVIREILDGLRAACDRTRVTFPRRARP